MKTILLVLLLGITLAAQQRPAAGEFYDAIRRDDLARLRSLIDEHGPDVRDAQGQVALMFAAAIGSLEAMRTLADAGADVTAASGSGATALHWAAGEPSKVRLLLDRGADVQARSSLGRTPLIVAASTSGTLDVVRMLLARGADVNVADTGGVTPLIAAASVDNVEVAQLLLERGADVHARAAGVGQSATALMGAAYNGNAALARLVLARTPDLEVVSADRSGTVKNGAVQFGSVTALHMAMAGGSPDVVQLLLDAGARPEPADVRGMTPLMWAVATDRPQPRVARMLVDRGADVSLRSTLGESATDWARKFNDRGVLAELKLQAAHLAPEPVRPIIEGSPASPRAAVERSMPLLRSASRRMQTDGGCVACHAQPLTAMAAGLAGARGWQVGAGGTELLEGSAALTSVAPALLQGREGGGQPDTQIYIALMMAALNAPPTAGTDALVHYLLAKQRPAGNWHGIGATRAPMQDGDFSRTALSIRTLAVFGMPARKKEVAARIQRAADWLAAQTPLTTEDRVMQLLGLHWAGAHTATRDVRRRELAAAQRADGGWSQTAHLPSDAYATGQALYTLRELATPAAEGTVERGVRFLLATQQADGSWHVRSRAMKIQPYFESGFPYGHDQWISHAATAWAAMALSIAG